MPKTIEQKRKEAEERNAAHANRTPTQQLMRITQRPGKSQRETAKILKGLKK